MTDAFRTDDDLLFDIDSAESGPPGDLHLFWLGQSGFLASSGGARVVFDPYLSDSLTKKYADTDRPHVRMIENVIAPDRLVGVLAVTSTHNHTNVHRHTHPNTYAHTHAHTHTNNTSAHTLKD